MEHRRSFAITALLALAIVAGGCGGSSSHSSSQAAGSGTTSSSAPSVSGGTAADQQAVLTAVNGYYAGLQARNGKQACEHLTPAAQKRIVAQITAHTSRFGHTCEQILGKVGLLISGQVHVVSGSVKGDTATVVIQGKSRGNVTLAKSSGHWVITNTS